MATKKTKKSEESSTNWEHHPHVQAHADAIEANKAPADNPSNDVRPGPS